MSRGSIHAAKKTVKVKKPKAVHPKKPRAGKVRKSHVRF